MRNVTRASPAVVATELVALYSAGNWAQLVTAATRSAVLVIGELLKAQKFSLQANNTTNDRGDHPGRDAQFDHINPSAALAARQSGIDASKLALLPAQGKETENRSGATNQKDSYQSCANGVALPMTPQT
jgi:Rhodopirellula transposase DDE domain